MPKDKRSRPAVAQEHRSRPYKVRGKGLEGDAVSDRDVREDWEDALCPICLEAPHNAVLLVCSSHADGCRPYMCNTSHRHSNCLDQFQKTQAGLQKLQHPVQAVSSSEEHSQQMAVHTSHAGDTLNLRIVDGYPAPPMRRPLRATSNSYEHVSDDIETENVIVEALHSRVASADSTVVTRRSRRSIHLPHSSRQGTEADHMHFLDSETGSEVEGSEGFSSVNANSIGSSSSKSKHLVCPLCRGQIFGWRVINAARKYFNGKARNCSHESCMFTGTYQELRVHARCEHPCAWPCEVDPARQRDWLRMERQREIGDVLSTIGVSNEDMNNDDGHWWSYLFLLHFFGPVNEESMISQLRDHHQMGSQRAASARFRELIENINRATEGTSIASESRTEGDQHTTRQPPNRQPRRRRGMS